MLSRLGKGDEVITRGGLIGKITGVSDDGVIVLELQEKVRVRVPRAYVEGKWEGKVPASATKAA
jgi:preprotein translocase subunit YajC